MDNFLETKIFPESENNGKTYIDPESTQIFIDALVKLKADIESAELAVEAGSDQQNSPGNCYQSN